MPDEPTNTRAQSRFSLLTRILVTVIALLAIAMLLLWREVRHVARLEAELGRLQVTDSERPHVIAVQTNEPLTWRWRVYLPPLLHGKYHFNFHEELFGTFALDRLRRESPQYEFLGRDNLPPSGELTIEAKLVDRDGHWFLEVQPFGEKRLGVSDSWRALLKDLGLPDQVLDVSAWTDKTDELAGVNIKRQMIFGRGDVVPLLLLEGPPIPISASASNSLGIPRPSRSPTLMLWIDNTQ
jgi:hypothetical protein